MRRILLAAVLAIAGCRPTSDRANGVAADTLVVFTAASLAAPMHVVLDTFASRTGVVVQEEHGASIELARRMTALGRTPDVVALADREVFPELLVPATTSWYASFARNRIVVAYTDRSRHAMEITPANWPVILQRGDVTVGRSDPAIAPVGYRTLLMYELAERFYGMPGLAARLSGRSPPAHIRGNATQLAALLAAGEIDYIVDYQSLAEGQGFHYVRLPPEIDLGDPAHEASYATETVRVAQMGDTVTRRGAAILYAVSIPRDARHRAAGERFLSFLLGAEGKAMMRARSVDMLDRAIVTGDSAPRSVVMAR